jgi:nucleotide-binding universal stress UspA family protein
MHSRPIIVAVDRSPESTAAARLGARLAERTGTRWRLVHAVRDPGVVFTAKLLKDRAGELDAALRELIGPQLHTAVCAASESAAPGELAIRIGRPAAVLQAEVERVGAGLVIIGGKHHLALGRWLGGSTALDAVRLLSVPMLVTADRPTDFTRVLVAVDLSPAAEPTIREAERFATLAQGRLRVIHVLESLTLNPAAARLVDQQQFDAASIVALQRTVWPTFHLPDTETALRHGEIVTSLAAEAREWRADLLVIGTHGKDWVDRLLLGSVTERLLNELPVPLLVVPTPQQTEGRQDSRVLQESFIAGG